MIMLLTGLNGYVGTRWLMADKYKATGGNETIYVGVTPGKTYEIRMVTWSEVDIWISVSSEINKITPTITDY